MNLAVHRNLPLVLAAVLSLLLHTAVLFPLLEVIGLGRFNDTADTTSLGKAQPGLNATTRDSELDKKRERRTERERQMQRKLNSRRIVQPPRQRPEDLAKDPIKERDEPLKPELTDEEKVELGIEESSAVTMNWIGYAEYETHMAALAEVEQAALRLEATSGAGGVGSPTLAPIPPSAATFNAPANTTVSPLETAVAMSPDPMGPPVPAEASPADAATMTALIAPTSPTPTSPVAATARTDPATNPTATQATDAETARPAPLPERVGADAVTVPAHVSTDLPTPLPVDDPNLAPAALPAEEHPVESDASDKPAPKPLDPNKVDPKADPSAHPPEMPDPSKTDPTKRLDAAKTGAANELPRENADPLADSPIPPTDAPTEMKDPSTDPNLVERPNPDRSVAKPPRTDAVNAPLGSVPGPQAIDAQPSTPTPPSPAGIPGDNRADQGELSTRESDPTSIMDVPMVNWRNGKPLARKGIALQTFRPKFSTLNIIDGIRSNPIVELVIGRDGVPQHVVIARGNLDAGVSDAIRSSLFKWRATGTQIQKLKPGQTLTIRLKLIMIAD